MRAKESEAKLGKLINAVKDDRAMRTKDYQAVLKAGCFSCVGVWC